MKTNLEQAREILKIVDRGEWKHSGHLPRNWRGEIEWSDIKTCTRILTEIDKARKEAIALLVAVELIDLTYSRDIIRDWKPEEQETTAEACQETTAEACVAPEIPF